MTRTIIKVFSYLAISVSAIIYTPAFAIGESSASCMGDSGANRCLTEKENEAIQNHVFYSCGGTAEGARPCPSTAQIEENLRFYREKMRSCMGQFCYQMNLDYGSTPPIVGEAPPQPTPKPKAGIEGFVIPEATSDWGCEVLLCLSNPNGAMAVSQCVPPIKKLFKELAKGHAFPSCAMGGAESENYAKNEYEPFDPCPSSHPVHVSDNSREGSPYIRTCRAAVQTQVCVSPNNSAPSCSMDYETSEQYARPDANKITVVNSGKVVSSFRW